MIPKPASRRALVAAIAFALLAASAIAGTLFVEGAVETAMERVLALLAGVALVVAAAGLYAGRIWAWWLGNALLLLELVLSLPSAASDPEPPVSLALGLVLLLFGAVWRLLANRSMLGPERPLPARAVQVISLVSTTSVIAGLVSIAFEFDGVLAATLAVVLGGLHIMKGRRRRTQAATESVAERDANAR